MIQAFFALRLQLFWVPLGKWGRENNFFRPGGWQLFGLHMWKKSGGKEAVVYSDARPWPLFGPQAKDMTTLWMYIHWPALPLESLWAAHLRNGLGVKHIRCKNSTQFLCFLFFFQQKRAQRPCLATNSQSNSTYASVSLCVLWWDCTARLSQN